MGDAAGNDDDGLGLCAALRATALAAASPAAVEWVVTGPLAHPFSAAGGNSVGAPPAPKGWDCDCRDDAARP